MEGFIRRIWGKYCIDRIVLMLKVIFIVRFTRNENKGKVLEEGVFMFDKKLMIVTFWISELEVKNFNVLRVLIWVRIMDLDLKY